MVLLEEIKDILVSNSIKYYLQGIFAGEACVRPTKFKSLDNVNIGAVNINDQEFYASCLLLLEICSSFEKNCIKIHNLKNFLKIYRFSLLKLHPIRYKKFLKHLTNYSQIPKKLKAEYTSIKEEVKDGILY